MGKSRTRKRKSVERPAQKRSWWGRNWPFIDSGITFGCLPVIAFIALIPVVFLR